MGSSSRYAGELFDCYMVGTKADQGSPSLVGAWLVLSSGMIRCRVARDLDRRATAASQLCLVADPGLRRSSQNRLSRCGTCVPD